MDEGKKVIINEKTREPGHDQSNGVPGIAQAKWMTAKSRESDLKLLGWQSPRQFRNVSKQHIKIQIC
jgi:hypothetical protein